MKKLQICLLFTGFFLPFALHAEITVLSELSHEYVMQPGATQQGVIEIMNMGEPLQTARVYQTDYSYQADGTSNYSEVGTVARSNATWIEFSPKQATIPPNEKVLVSYSIHAPDSTLTGSYWSMLMIEPVSEIKPEQKQGIQVLTLVRYGVQVITQIGNTGEKSIRFQNTQLIRKDGGRFLQLDIGNDGDRYVQPNIWVEVFDTTGQFMGKFETRQARLLPGCSIRREIDISTLQTGEYKALIVVDCGDEDLFGMNLTLKIEP